MLQVMRRGWFGYIVLVGSMELKIMRVAFSIYRQVFINK